MANILTKLLTMGERRQFREYEAIAEQVNGLEPGITSLTDEELRGKTEEFRARIAEGETIDDLMVEAFGVVREAAVRTLGMRHFDVQVIGGVVLHRGLIAEMKTGEGKTLAATLPVYLNALKGEGVHVVTVNDYLAKRDSEWMGQVYRFLGMEIGLLQNRMPISQRRPAYQADITYGTNTEFGFDYLRDNMVTRADQRVQRGHHYAIVDEVDSILIDEARTPLIISGPAEQAADTYRSFAKAVPRLKPEEDFELDEAKRTVAPTEEGIRKAEKWLGIDDLYGDPSGRMVNHLQQALKAEFLFTRDVDYVVKEGEVIIVDEFTGRLMEGRRYSEGLHQAIEAKEKQTIRQENQTLATITLQNYFRMYDKLGGMTGTAVTEDAEFREIYGLGVVVVPTNEPMIREDRDDMIYKHVDAKFDAVAEHIKDAHERGQPVLVGTISIENSERLSRSLTKRGIPHQVLNAKHHEREAQIVAQAGRKGAVTIATNMAGRGTDIILGGNPDFLAEELLRDRGVDPEEADEERRKAAEEEARRVTREEHDHVIEAGGLLVLGTERHDSRRIDNQLRGRSGRQGDPGASQFYLSLQDDLLRLFGQDRMERIQGLMERTQIPDDMPIQAGMVSKAIENAQTQVETMHFGSRKHVLEYDDVMNKQREVIYAERNRVLEGKDIHGRVKEMLHEQVTSSVLSYCPEKVYPEEWDWDGLKARMFDLLGLDIDIDRFRSEEANPYELADTIASEADERYEEKEAEVGAEQLRELERQVMLKVIDARWKEHLLEMDYLKSGIGLRAMGQRDPLVEYKSEAFEMFGQLVDTINEDFLKVVMRIQVIREQKQPETPRDVSYSAPTEQSIFSGVAGTGRRAASSPAARAGAGGVAAGVAGGVQTDQSRAAAQHRAGKTQTIVKDKDDPFQNVGRNDPCPCGSGKKFKKCHGA